MTVACYDGETLAADRMSRVKDGEGGRKVKSLEQEKILVDFDNTVFDGEKVYAVGRAGRLKVSMAMIEILSRSRDLATTLDKVEEKLRKRVPEKNMAKAALLVMTANHIHILRIAKNYKVTWQKENRSKKVAIGSGKTTAEFLMRHLGMSAEDAVAAMELHHDCCGGGVCSTTRIRSLQRNPIKVTESPPKRQLAKNLLSRTIQSARAQLDIV